MKISEVIALTFEKPLKDIAKEINGISEKPLRSALKMAGCVPNKGKKGWHIAEGEPVENLEKSIFEFVQPTARKRVTANVSTNEQNNKTTKETKKNNSKEQSNLSSLEVTNQNTKEQTSRKRASFDIDREILKRLKIKSAIEERHTYELVEQALREYLDK